MSEFFRPDPPGQTAFPVARAGYPFIFVGAFTTAILALLGLTALTLIALVITLCICGFFRDPDRVVPAEKDLVVSPADGKIIHAGPVKSSPFGRDECTKISIFMSVFNVHVNRAPCTGKVKQIDYYPGKFFSANLDKASQQNEHNAIEIEMEDGRLVGVVQIAGLIARRIICYIGPGDQLRRGQRFGLICFGSRLDVYLPPGIKPKVTPGDMVKAGTSILGRLE